MSVSMTMEQYALENIPRYHTLVKKFEPPKPIRRGSSNEGNASPDMVVTTRLRPLLEEEVSVGWPMSLFPRAAEKGVLDVHELRRPARGPALLRVCSV